MISGYGFSCFPTGDAGLQGSRRGWESRKTKIALPVFKQVAQGVRWGRVVLPGEAVWCGKKFAAGVRPAQQPGSETALAGATQKQFGVYLRTDGVTQTENIG